MEIDGEILLPRREIVSVPFAFHALNSDSLGGLSSASFSLTGHSHDEVYVNQGQDSSVTAAMVLPDIVSSIDGVTNDCGDIDLVAGSNITITPDDANDRITIEAAGGAGGDITAVYADGGLSGGSTTGDAHLSVNTGTGLEVSGDAVRLTSGYFTGSAYDSRFINEAQTSSVTAAMVVPDIVSSVDGVSNDGGNIDLIAGSNITITPNDGGNTITIASTATGDGHSLDAADGSPINAVYVDNTGEVGIGTTSPGTNVHIKDESIYLPQSALYADVAVVEDDDAILGLYSHAEGAAGSAVTFGEIYGGELIDKWAIVREATLTGDGGLRITCGTDNDQFGNDVVMYLHKWGRVRIGTRSVGTYELYVAGDAYATGGWTPSDRRFKQDIEEIESALDKVLSLRGVLFKWKTEEYADKGFPEGRHFGVIAQEAEAILPEIVKDGPDGEKAIAYTEIVPVLIESIKELRAENEVLKQRLASIEMAVGLGD